MDSIRSKQILLCSKSLQPSWIPIHEFPYRQELELIQASSIQEVVQQSEQCQSCLIISEYELADGTIFDLIGTVSTPVMFIGRAGEESKALEALEWGAVESFIWTGKAASAALLAHVIQRILNQIRSDQELRDSQRLLMTIAENYPSYFSIIDPDYTVGFTSGYEFKRSGFDSGAFIGMSIDQVFGEFAPFIREKYALAFQGEPQSFDLNFNEQYQFFRVTPLFSDDGTVTQILSVVEDVTDQKLAELTLAKERNLLRTIIDSVPDLIFVKDLDGKIILNNTAHQRFVGLEAPDLVFGKTAADLFPASKANQFMEEDQRVIEGKVESHVSTETITNINDEECWTVTTKVPLKGLDNKITGLVGITHDITTLKQKELLIKQREQELFESQNMLQLVLDSIPVRVFWKDRNCTMIGANNLFVKDAGYQSVEDVIGKTNAELFPGEADGYTEDDLYVMESGIARIGFEEYLTTPEGEVIWLETSKIPLRNLEDEVIGVLGTYTDISARKESEEQLQYLASIQAHMSDAVVSTDMDLRIVTWNRAAEEMYGWHAPEVIGKNMLEIMPPEAVDGIKTEDTLKDIFERGYWSGEIQHPKKNGEKIYNLASVVLNVDKHGEPVGLISVNRDITHMKRAEIALREKEERFRQLAENVSDLITKHDSKGICTYATPSATSVLGYEPDELIGQTGAELIHPEDRPSIPDLFDNDPQNEGSRSFIYRAKHKDGHYVWVESTFRLIKSPATGRLIEKIISSRNITQRMESESEIRILSQRLELAAQAGGVGIWDWNVSKNRMVIDDQIRGIYGITKKPAFWRIEQWEELIHPEDRAKTKLDIESAIAQSTNLRIEFRINRFDNKKQRYILSSADIQRDAAGRAIRMIGTNTDITDLKEAENQLKVALERERELGELKSRFVSIASHEFRTPLASILSASETIENYFDRLTADQIQERFESIREKILYMKGLIDDVLHLEQIRSGRVRFDPKISDITALIQTIVQDFDRQEAHAGRIHATLPADPIQLEYDRQLIHQAVSNIISNALKYSPSDSPVEVELKPTHDQLVLSVRDYGIGIPEKDLTHLFEPFHRAQNVGSIKGTGLGLSITKQAIETHRGEIFVESAVGNGTCFTIQFPL